MRHLMNTKHKARELRNQGLSLNQIHKEIKVPITTISSWVQDIILTKGQSQVLSKRTQEALQKGRINAQRIQKDKRAEKEKVLMTNGKDEIGVLNKRELFISGIALYWAEGFKNRYEHRLGFCNSDPSMIKFYIYWLIKCLKVETNEIVARLTLNQIYKNRIAEMQDYWSKTVGIHPNQFTKPFFQTSKWKKQYNTDNYHGVLRIHVKESLDYLLKMKGWIEGLKLNVKK